MKTLYPLYSENPINRINQNKTLNTNKKNSPVFCIAPAIFSLALTGININHRLASTGYSNTCKPAVNHSEGSLFIPAFPFSNSKKAN